MANDNKLKGVSALDGSYLKIKRAKYHIDDLHSQMHKFFDDSDVYKVITAFDVATRQECFYIVLDKPMPTDWPLIVGDAAFNLISALDHLYVALVIKNGKAVAKTDHFPICDNLSHFENLINNGVKSRIGDDATRVFESDIQPYGIEDGDFRKGNLLRAIKALRNHDGHNMLIPTGAVSSDHRVFIGDREIWGSTTLGKGRDRLDLGIKLIPVERIDGVTFSAEGAVEPKPQIRSSGKIRFADIGLVSGKRVIPTLMHSIREVTRIFKLLHPVFV